MQYRADHYLRYQELTDLLHHFEKSYPNLMQLSSIGKSPKGRELWLVTITNKTTGSDHEKPAYWVDGNTHASELASAQACVHTIHHLLTTFDGDARTQYLLNHFTFYILPRIAVDGAEYFLQSGDYVRSSDELYPKLDFYEGLVKKDMDGDGEILFMRIADASGRWKQSQKDYRLMIPRPIDEVDENEIYYRLLNEGEIENFDGHHEKIARKHGLDFNRQFPTNWMPEGEQVGAGDHALSQVEMLAVVKAINARKNICGAQSFHTYSGAILRPFINKADAQMEEHDLNYYKEISKRGEELTGYSAVSVHHNFRYHPLKDVGGGFLAWAYDHKGILAFTNEIWDLHQKAGIKYDDLIAALYKGYSEEEWMKIFSWMDQHFAKDEFFKAWKSFDHPQLGRVEIGGLKTSRLINNPPEKFLEVEVQKNMEFVLSCAMTNPMVKIEKNVVEKLANNHHHIKIYVKNYGHLPTNGSAQALKMQAVNPPQISCALKGLTLVQGKAQFLGEHLSGRSQNARWRTLAFGGIDINSNSRCYEWIVKGEGEFKVTFNYERGGIVSTTLQL
jgi:murein tripeptide amidase MpaA